MWEHERAHVIMSVPAGKEYIWLRQNSNACTGVRSKKKRSRGNANTCISSCHHQHDRMSLQHISLPTFKSPYDVSTDFILYQSQLAALIMEVDILLWRNAIMFSPVLVIFSITSDIHSAPASPHNSPSDSSITISSLYNLYVVLVDLCVLEQLRNDSHVLIGSVGSHSRVPIHWYSTRVW